MFFKWNAISIDIKILFDKLIRFNQLFPCSSSAFFCFSPWSSIVVACFWRAFPKRESLNLACSVTLLWSGGSISSLGKYLCLSIFAGYKVDIFGDFQLISYCNFSSLMLSSIAVISFYIFQKDSFYNVKDYLMQEWHQ